MKYLVDTNIWLAAYLQSQYRKEADDFLNGIPSNLMAISEFSLYSACLAIEARQGVESIREWHQRWIGSEKLRILRIAADEFSAIMDCMQNMGLDFDDAYQYVAAKQNNLAIVSFDADFDRTQRGRKTPGQVLAETKGQ